MPISRELLDILACPKCKGDIHLTSDGKGLVCDNCKLLYEIRDPLLGQGVLHLTALPLSTARGFVVRTELSSPPPAPIVAPSPMTQPSLERRSPIALSIP